MTERIDPGEGSAESWNALGLPSLSFVETGIEFAFYAMGGICVPMTNFLHFLCALLTMFDKDIKLIG